MSITDPNPKRLGFARGGLQPDVSRAGDGFAYVRLGEGGLGQLEVEGGAGPIPVASSTLVDIDAALHRRSAWLVNDLAEARRSGSCTGRPGGHASHGRGRQGTLEYCIRSVERAVCGHWVVQEAYSCHAAPRLSRPPTTSRLLCEVVTGSAVP